MQIRPITTGDDAAMAAIVRSSLASHELDIPGTAYFDPELDHLSKFYNAQTPDTADSTASTSIPPSDSPNNDTSQANASANPPSARAYFVAVDDQGAVVGGAGFAAFGGQPGVAELQKLYVSPAAQHQGLGHQLVALVEQRAAEAGYATLYVETHHNLTDAMRLYQQLGYTQLEAPLPGSAHTTMDRFFSKPLTTASASETTNDPSAKQKQSDKDLGLGIGLGMLIGVAIGTITGDLAVWISLGLAIGVAISSSFNHFSKR